MDTATRLPNWRGYSRALAGASVLPPQQVGTDAGIGTIRTFVEDVGGGALIAHLNSHLVWLAGNRRQLAPCCNVLCPPDSSLKLATSKRLQVELATRIGLNVLPTWWLKAPSDVEHIPESAFPVVVRPDGETTMKPYRKVTLVTSAGALQELIGHTVLSEPMSAQPFRALPNLLVHGVRSEQGGLLAMEPFLVRRKFQGVSLTVEHVALTGGKLRTLCSDFVTAAGITGPFHFEFLFSPEDETAYFLEINVRLGGTTDKVVQLGFDEPHLTLAAYGLVPAVQALPPRNTGRVAVNKRTLFKHAGRALQGALGPLDYPPVGRWTHVWLSARDLLRGRDSIFDLHDLRGSLRFHTHGARR
jgi:hypothetical protein